MKEFTKNIIGEFLQTPITKSIFRFGVWIYAYNDCLIDTGFSKDCDEVLGFVRSMGIKTVLITHAHEDHAGCIGVLQRHGYRVVVPEILGQDIELMSKKRLPLYRRLFWGEVKPLESRLEYSNEVNCKDKVLKYIHTPGHSRSHHVIWQPDERVVFLGDLFVGPRMTMAHPWEDPKTIMKSLKKIIDLKPDLAFCAHRGILKHPIRDLTIKYEYLQWLIQRSQELHRQGLSVEKIAYKLLGREKLVSMVTGGAYSRVNVINSIINGPGKEFEE